MRAFAASVVGWVLVAIVLFVLLGALIGTVWFVLRTFIWLVLLVGLLMLYLTLKAPPDDD